MAEKTDKIADRDEALEMLTTLARGGSVSAAIALARELRAVEKQETASVEEELDRLLTK